MIGLKRQLLQRACASPPTPQSTCMFVLKHIRATRGAEFEKIREPFRVSILRDLLNLKLVFISFETEYLELHGGIAATFLLAAALERVAKIPGYKVWDVEDITRNDYATYVRIHLV